MVHSATSLWAKRSYKERLPALTVELNQKTGSGQVTPALKHDFFIIIMWWLSMDTFCLIFQDIFLF
jgi:hypothetical protein